MSSPLKMMRRLLDIRIAYDVRRGNPLKKYNPSDFKLGQQPIRFDPEPRNVDVVECEGNRVVIDITNSDFSFGIVGFDKRRQLYINVTVREVIDAD